jgi:oxygen-independent coproporphyrinogen-3 oxidase
MRPGIYVHVPFCREKCHYCAFYSIALSERPEGRGTLHNYKHRLIKEIRERAGLASGADTLYFGGGTPSLFDPEDILDIISAIRESSGLNPYAEVTLEMNPEDASRDRIAGYVSAGVNRIVLGVQTSVSSLHMKIGRSAKICGRADLGVFFSAGGFERCADIITGIPDESDDDFKKDLINITDFKPDHVSVYLLAIESATPLGLRLVYDQRLEERQLQHFRETVRLMKDRGYIHYEISNYALPGRESRHNMKYWRYGSYLGLGPSSHSFLRNVRTINRMGIDEYLGSEQTVLELDSRSKKSEFIEYVMTGLRLIKGISVPEMEEALGRAPEGLIRGFKAAERDGFIEIEGVGRDIRVRLTETGIVFADRVNLEVLNELL